MTRRRNRWQGREGWGDHARAFGLALLLHAGLFGLLYVGMWWTPQRPPPSIRGEVIEAVLVAAPASAARPRSTPRPAPPKAPPPQPKPVEQPRQAETPPQPAPQQPQPKPDVAEQQRIQKLAQQQAEEKARQEQEERRRQEQIDLTERQKQQEEAERRERLRQQALEREKQLADIRRLREEAERERKEAEKALKALEDRRDSPVPAERVEPEAPPQRAIGNNGVNDDLLGRYTLAIDQAIRRNWIRPDNMPLGVSCQLNITQAPGGTVVAVSVAAGCPYDELGRRSIEAAVRRAEPLPYRGFEPVFRPQLIITFTPQD